MAKKAQKGKPAKKATKPVKKAAVKKQAKPAKKSSPAKKAGKPAKKAAAKKPVKPVKKANSAKKQNKPVKKTAPKKPVKKVAAKKPGKKIVSKKPVAKKPVKKVQLKKQAKKPVAKKQPVKKAVAKKPVAKKTEKGKRPSAAKEMLKKVAKAVVGTAAAALAVGAATSKNVQKAVMDAVTPEKKEKVAWTPKRRPKIKPKSEVETIRPRQEIKIDMTKPVMQRMEKPQPKPQINKDTRTRYTDAELQEFKDLILKKLEEAQKDYELLKSTLSHKDDHGTDDTSPTFKLLEDGSDVLSKEETAHLAARQEKFIQNLQNALIRIENKTYGVCRATGKLISKERLRSVPHATLSIDAKLDQKA